MKHIYNEPQKSLVIIGAHPNTEYSVQILKKTILSLKDDFDILLSTHYPVNKDIQDMVNYYIYDYRNEIIPWEEEYYIFWSQHDNFYFQNIEKRETSNHHYGVYRLMMNSITFIKDYYEDFYYIDYDCSFDKSDLEKLKTLKKDTKEKNKKSCFFARSDNFFNTIVFWSETEHYLNVMPIIKTSEEFIKRTNNNNCLEHFLGNSYLNYDSFSSVNRMLDIHPSHYFQYSQLAQSDLIRDKKPIVAECRTLLLRDMNSNNIFFVYNSGGHNLPLRNVEIKIDGGKILEVDTKISQTIYVPIYPKSDKIQLEVNNICKEYVVEEILQNTANYIKFNTN